jgi:cytochrome c oxidase cbb3-type subunit 3
MTRALLLMSLGALALVACEREERRFRESPPGAPPATLVRMSPLQPGVPRADASARSEYGENAWATSEGKRLFSAFNCVGCHGHGGGGMGPPLMDDEWIYGSNPENVYATIVEGRPNGMPSFGGRLTTQQVWQLVAYVRSMSGLLRSDVSPARDDHMMTRTPEQAMPRPDSQQSFTPPQSERP